MKTIEIIGKNYSGSWDKSRTACRGIVMKGHLVLLSYETLTGLYMIPGGGMEDGEDEAACCVRELVEETGIVTKPSSCVLEIDEYYEDWKYISKYFVCEVTGSCGQKLTYRERSAGMEPRWVPVEEAIEIFSRHEDYAASDEMRRGIYLWEYNAMVNVRRDLHEEIKSENESVVTRTNK
ncbi:MAG: NUDIX domain-containing protein [Treponema sp.]|nr:NUDIX domain-containing protein [Treponema sp.]